MRAPELRLYSDEIIVDSFAGGGGASLGIEMATGRSPDIAINHDAEAISMHKRNHPGSEHYVEDVWRVNPEAVVKGRKVGLMWLSPDCKHHSKAKGGKPRDSKIRGLAWVAVHWARAVRPRVLCLENVEEFQKWGPLLADGTPCPARIGITFRRWVRMLEVEGYKVEWRELIAADHGSPTTRKRLFVIARCDGQPIVWPTPTHDKEARHGRKPWRSAASCIDWTHEVPSIFTRTKPLADNTMRRIHRGIQKYVIDAAEPFIVPVTHAGGEGRVYSINDPMRTVTAAHRGELGLAVPTIVGAGGPAYSAKPVSAGAPMGTQTTENHRALSCATLVQTGYGERPGQAPRVPGLAKPLGTCVNGVKHALVAASLLKQNGIGKKMVVGQELTEPMHTVTSVDQKALAAAFLTKFRGTSRDGQGVVEPLHTISAQGFHFGEVRAFLTKYHRDGGQLSSCKEPMPTVVCNDSLGLVTVRGEQYVIADIGLRMLQPRELFNAQGFPSSYVIETGADDEKMTKSAQVRMCGNSVCPPLAAAIVAAQFTEAALVAAGGAA